jgi:hypothetical protein
MWLSRRLSYRGWVCDHDQAVYLRSVADVAAFLALPCHGSAETAAAPGWELLRHLVPDLRTVVIRRPIDEAFQSYLAIDLKGLATYDEPAVRRMLEYLDRALDRVARQPGVLALDFADLEHEDACRAVWEHCLPHPWDRARWLAMRDVNIQCDTLAQIIHYHRNREQVETFKLTIGRELRRLARAGLIGRRRLIHAV